MLRKITVAILLVAMSIPSWAQIMTTRNGSVSTSVVKKKTTVSLYPSGWEMSVSGSYKLNIGSNNVDDASLPILGASYGYRKIKNFPDASGTWGYYLGADLSYGSCRARWYSKSKYSETFYEKTHYLTLRPQASVFIGGRKWTFEVFAGPEINFFSESLVGLELGYGLRYRPTKAMSIFLSVPFEFTEFRCYHGGYYNAPVVLFGPNLGLTFHL